MENQKLRGKIKLKTNAQPVICANVHSAQCMHMHDLGDTSEIFE